MAALASPANSAEQLKELRIGYQKIRRCDSGARLRSGDPRSSDFVDRGHLRPER
jgi:hypothetical protein